MVQFFDQEELDLLWKASFLTEKQLRLDQHMQINVSHCISLIKAHIQKLSPQESIKFNLEYFSRLLLGLSSIISFQAKNSNKYFKEYMSLSLKTRINGRKKKTKSYKIERDTILFETRNDPTFQTLWKLVDEDLEIPELTMESLPMEVENCSHPSHLTQECDFMNSNEETNPFFQNIDDQISSVDFTNDFQDILDEHFSKNNDNNNLERRKSSFSRFNFDFSEEIEQCSNDVQSITSEIIDVDKQSTTVDVYDEPIKEIKLPNSKQNRKGIQMKRKRRGWRHRFPKNKTNKIPILKRFLGMWCSSKKGYSYLKQQLNDSQLTEFSQPFISPQLKKYFSHKKLVSSPIVKQSLPQSLSSNKSSSIGCEQLSLHSCEKQLDNNDQLEFCTTSDFLNEVRQDRNRVSYIDCNQLVTQMLDDIIHRTQDLSLVDFIHNNSSNRSNLKSFAAQTFSHLLNEPRIVLHQTNTILNNSLKHNDIIIKLA